MTKTLVMTCILTIHSHRTIFIVIVYFMCALTSAFVACTYLHVCDVLMYSCHFLPFLISSLDNPPPYTTKTTLSIAFVASNLIRYSTHISIYWPKCVAHTQRERTNMVFVLLFRYNIDSDTQECHVNIFL